MRNLVGMLAVTSMVFAGANVSLAGSGKDAPVTPATTIHGAPGNTAGFSDQAYGAAPAGTADGADGGIHNIAGVRANAGNIDGNPASTAHGGRDTWLADKGRNAWDDEEEWFWRMLLGR